MTRGNNTKRNPPTSQLGGTESGDNQDEGRISDPAFTFKYTRLRAQKSTASLPKVNGWTEAEEQTLFELRGHYWHLIAEQAATESEIKRLQEKRNAALGEGI